MNGLDLSRRYYNDYCAPMLRAGFPELSERVAAGLAGEGSECLGFDDEISRDHDWGAAICLWLTEEDHKAHAETLREALDALSLKTGDLPMRRESHMAAGRGGVMETGSFYRRHTGLPEGPRSLAEWMRVSEEHLAAATSGAVFADPLGRFSAIRERLLRFYPEDARRKKLAARLAMMAQTGQYNLDRCLKRGEKVAARLAESLFMQNAMSTAFLLNRRYTPFYKWTHRALRALPVLGPVLAGLLEALPAVADNGKSARVEEICRLVAEELRRQGLSDVHDDFLLTQARIVQNGIQDDTLRGLHLFVG